MNSLIDVYKPHFMSPPRKTGETAIVNMQMKRVSLLTLLINRPDSRNIDCIYAPRYVNRRDLSNSMPLIIRKGK